MAFGEKNYVLAQDGKCLVAGAKTASCTLAEVDDSHLWRLAEFGHGFVLLHRQTKRCLAGSSDGVISVRTCVESDRELYFFVTPDWHPRPAVAAEAPASSLNLIDPVLPQVEIRLRSDKILAWKFSGLQPESQVCVRESSATAGPLCFESTPESPAALGIWTSHTEPATNLDRGSAEGWNGWVRSKEGIVTGPYKASVLEERLDLVEGASCLNDECVDLTPRVVGGTSTAPTFTTKMSFTAEDGSRVQYGYSDCTATNCFTDVTPSEGKITLQLDGSRSKHGLDHPGDRRGRKAHLSRPALDDWQVDLPRGFSISRSRHGRKLYLKPGTVDQDP